MESKHGYLTSEQVARLEQMQLKGREAHVRDAFLFCCYTGLRVSDFIDLKTENIQDGWIVKKMIKTGFLVEVPLGKIFGGKAQLMITRYGSVESLNAGLGKNSDINATLHDILRPFDIQFHCTFHTSRHTFATLLLQSGLPMTAIQQMLGHRKIETTAIYGERDRKTLTAALEKQNGKR